MESTNNSTTPQEVQAPEVSTRSPAPAPDAASLMGQIIDSQTGVEEAETQSEAPVILPPLERDNPMIAPSAGELMGQILDSREGLQPATAQGDSSYNYADLFRGDPLSAEDRAEFPNASTYAERELLRAIEKDKISAHNLGAAVLNHMPELLTSNTAFVLQRLGLDPGLVEQVENLNTLARLPDHIVEDMLNGDPKAAEFNLQMYRDREEEVLEQTRIAFQQEEALNARTTQALDTGQWEVFSEFIEKGKSLGLNELEAAGLAAMAYGAMIDDYYSEKSESRKAVDRWRADLRAGSARSKLSRADFRKVFDQHYRKVAGKHRPASARESKATNERRSKLSGSGLMADILSNK